MNTLYQNIPWVIIIMTVIPLVYIALKLGYESLPFLNYSMVIFGFINLLRLYVSGQVSTDISIAYLLSMFAALCAFCVLLRPRSYYRSTGAVTFATNISNSLILKVIFIIYVSLKSYQIYCTYLYGWGGARVIVAKDNIIITVIYDLLTGPAYAYILTRLGRGKYAAFGFVFSLCLLTGSKAAALSYVFEIAFLYRLCFGKLFMNSLFIIVLAIGGFFLAIFLFYREDVSVSTLDGFVRYRGDVYELLFAKDLREKVFDIYDSSYFVHHTLRMLGSRAYDAPAGTALVSFDHGIPLSETSGGPITPFFVVWDLVYSGNLLLICLSSCLGFLSVILLNRGCATFRNSPNIASLIVGYWLMQSWYLIVDPTVFLYRITPVFWIIVLPQLMFTLLTGLRLKIKILGAPLIS